MIYKLFTLRIMNRKSSRYKFSCKYFLKEEEKQTPRKRLLYNWKKEKKNE